MFGVGGWVGAACPAICAVKLRMRVLCLLFGKRCCRFVSGLCATDSPPSFAPFHAPAFSVSGIACKPWARERCIEQPHSHKAPPHPFALSRSCAVRCGGALGCAPFLRTVLTISSYTAALFRGASRCRSHFALCPRSKLLGKSGVASELQALFVILAHDGTHSACERLSRRHVAPRYHVPVNARRG